MRRAALALSAALWAFVAPAQAPAPGAGADKPPVLIITLDTTRADRLGCYGHTGGLTRNLDALAETATVFLGAQTAIPQTVPAHTTLFSGLDPSRSGVRKNLEVRVPADIPLLAEEYRAAGYSTGAFVSSFVVMGHFGLGRGFDTFEDSFYRRGVPSSVERRAPDTVAKALPWILAQKGPWFCWIHLYDPHFPYAPPGDYAKRFAGREYDGEVAFMDASLGVLFRDLERAGLLDRTLVVACGDHGESLGEHGEPTHSFFLYDATTRVPLILKRPGQTAGTKVDRAVGLVDLAPTLRALCGLKAKPSDGVSLLPLLTGGTFQRGPVYLETLEPLYSYGWAPLYGAVDAGLKYILAPRPELYQLERDPGEKVNAAAAQPAQAKRLRGWLQARVQADAKSAQARPKMKLDDEELKSLQSLGYIAGTPGAAAGGVYRDPKEMVEVMAMAAEAERAVQSGRPQEGAALLEKMIARDPANPVFHFQLGGALERSDPARSEAAFKKSIQLRPTFPQAYSRLMVAWFNTDRAQEAYTLGRAGLAKVDDVDGEIHALTGYAALKAGRPEAEVLGYFDEAAKRGPEFPVALKGRAILAMGRGDKEAAMGYILAMAKDAPSPYLIQLEKDERFAPLREDPRFWAVLMEAKRKLGMK